MGNNVLRTLSISIIVPVYNVGEYIEDCFASIVGQTYQGPMDCLFIDDCGSDSSVQILERLIKGYDGPINMRLLHHDRNMGLSAARNTGITQSKGDYLFFLDSDDKLYPNSIASLSDAAAEENQPDMILGGYHVNVPASPVNRYKYQYDVLEKPRIIRDFLEGSLYCMAPNKLVQRDFVFKNELYFKEGIIHEDNLWSFQSFHMAQKIVTIPEVTYFYLIRDDSIMTSGQYERSLLSTVTIYDEIKNDLYNNRYAVIDKASMKYIEDRLDMRCDRLIKSLYSESKNRKQRTKRLKELPDNLKHVIDKYWLARTPFLKLLKKTFKCRCYTLFDVLMVLSLKKNNEFAKSFGHSSCI